MQQTISQELRRRVRQKRGNRTFRQVEQECGVQYSTLCRFENGRGGIQLHTAAKLIQWTGLDARKLFKLPVENA
jgi:transcriptional regulator with XRE-family HTH domain